MLRIYSLLVPLVCMTIAPDAAGATRASNGQSRPSRAAINSASVAQQKSIAAPRVSVARSASVGRAVTMRGVQQKTVVARSAQTETVSSLTDKKQITDFCKAQYTQCMDNFCNVLDDNQGRCSCSTNLKNYAATEEALAKATEELQDVAQKIQYIGLTADEIETLFTQTEAELTMQNKSDNTQLKNDLDKIKGLIVDVKSGNAAPTDTGISLDLSGLLDFTISSTGFDLTSMFGGTNNTTSISNQRGETLYKTATARCKASVLNTCAAQGVDISLITNAYDLEIDKQCIQYERSLTETNSQMASTVRNAKSVLQKARLMVAQQKNAYDLRGCVNALDTCMQDDFVCGSDYENCLDPTGKWIVNGEVVVGSQPDKNTPVDADIATMLRNKIGVINGRGRPSGMCAAVMQKCQNYTMQDGKYNADNALIAEYVSQTIIKIKARRAALLDEYAQGCIADVISCLGRNNRGASMNSDSAINSCMPVIKTCKSLTTGNAGGLDDIRKWLANIMGDKVMSNPDEMKPEPDMPDIPDISADLETIKQTDYERCRNIPGGRVSYSGTLCVIWRNVSDSDSLFDLATSYGWAQLSYGDSSGFRSYLAGKSSLTETYDMYVMQWAYKEALNECESLGGTLDFAPGVKRANAFAFCEMK